MILARLLGRWQTHIVRGGMAGSIATIAILWVFFQTGQLFGQSQNNNRAFELPHRSHNYFHDGGSLQLRPATGDESPSSVSTFAHAKKRVLKSMNQGLNDSIDFSKFRLSLQRRLESNLVNAEIAPRPGTPAYGQYAHDRPTNDQALDKNYDSLVAIGASMQLTQVHCLRFGLSAAECSRYVSTLRLDRPCSGSQQHILCDPSAKYRSVDGSCNNLENPQWGSAFTAYDRILLPEYTDGIQSPKKEFGVHALPNPRLVSATLSSRRTDRQEGDKTLAFMQWSRFVSHDLSFTPTRKMVWTKAPIRCCEPDGSWPAPRYVHPDCQAIRVPDDDADYSRHRIRCLDYARSMTALRSDCSLGPAEQMNQASHFLDASNVYGSSQADSHKIRSFQGGQLRVARKNDRDYLPHDDDSYVSGDQRINGDVQAAAMQTLWLREHNRLARALAKLNPHWSDETIFQEARRIVVAEIQHVTYHEWLPLLIGKRYARTIADRSPRNRSDDDGLYNVNSEPGVYNEVATSALTFAHSLRQASLSLVSEDDYDAHKSNESLELAASFYEPRLLEAGETLDGLVRGFARQSSRKLDFTLAADLGSRLYKTNESAAGLDRLSFDIQRGRDHGLADYNDYRHLCGLRQAKSFDDFLDHVPGESVKLLRKLYKTPGDVDLLVGGLAERSIEDAAIGPTFRCLIAAQFLRTRRADRFFYDSTRQPKPFTTNQMAELKKATLARIFCDNGDNIAKMQSNVFLKPQVGNELQSCQNFDAIERIDLTKWIENIAY
ncbi:peroxidase-like isoform X1 [Trichogramma pretiosum]|uniref:peroxidase-like isoform X1 n=2 Tax=Trichogramma pretiosum TaxID=7493 RepID=UPI000C71A3BB|nr:peroxidase-like isoform X1 [Trichogramma pretiosum]